MEGCAVDTKTCTTCGETKPVTQFRQKRKLCHSCYAVVRKEKGYDAAWVKKRAEKDKELRRASRGQTTPVDDQADLVRLAKTFITLLAQPQIRAALREALKDDTSFLD